MTQVHWPVAGKEYHPAAPTTSNPPREDVQERLAAAAPPDPRESATGYPDRDSVMRHRNFDLRLPAGIEKQIEPIKLLALANGYIVGHMSKAEFFRAVEVLRMPVLKRYDAMERLGIAWNMRMGLMADDWAFIGIMNGVIDVADFGFIDQTPFDLTNPAFWRKHFPQCVDAHGAVGPLPDLIPEDWSHIGRFRDKLHVEPEITTRQRIVRHTTLELTRIGFPGYWGHLHYVTCVAARRLASAPIGPLGEYRNSEEAMQAFTTLFGRRQSSEDEAGKFFPCTIV